MRFRNVLPVVVAAVAAMLGGPDSARAGYSFRVTELNGAGQVVATQTQTGLGNAASFTFTGLTDFDVTLVNNLTITGGGVTKATPGFSINALNPGSIGKSVLIEVLGDSFVNPSVGTASFISANAGPSANTLAASLTYDSSVINGNAALTAAPSVGSSYSGITAALLGTVELKGSMGNNVSSLLTPNPGQGSNFTIGGPFSFYQTILIGNVTTAGTGSFSSATTVQPTPAPAGLVLGLTGMPVLGLFGWLRRRKAAPVV